MIVVRPGLEDVVDPPPRQRGEVGQPASDVAGLSSSSSGSRPRNRATSIDVVGDRASRDGGRTPRAARRGRRAAPNAEPRTHACGTSTSHVATSARIITPSRSPPPDSFRSGTAECASQPDRSMRASRGLTHLGQPPPRVATPVGQHLGPQGQHEPGVAGHRAGVEHPGGGAMVLHGGLAHLHGVAHRVVECDAAVPQRVPDRLGDLPHPVLGNRRIVQQDDVEVAGRRQLGTAVATDGDEREPLALSRIVTRTHRRGEQPAQQPVGLERAVAALLREGGSWRGLVVVGQLATTRTRRSRRCARAPPTRPGRPTPCRRRSCRCGRRTRSCLTTASASASSTTTSTRIFGTSVTSYSAPR